MAEQAGLERFRLIRRIKPAGEAEPAAAQVRSDTIWLWHAVDTLTGLEVALKGVARRLPPAIRDMLRNDGARANALVPLLDLIESDGVWVEVTPWFAEGTLADRLTRIGRIGQAERIDEAERLLACMRDALGWMHRNNPFDQTLVHNDIKPSNIFVDGESFRLGDFGNMAIRPTGLAGSNPISASAAYAPPERFDSGFSEPGDFWSLGLAIAEILFGHHPFTEIGADGRVVQIANSASLPANWTLPNQSISRLPDAWRALLYGLTAMVPAQRWGLSQINNWLSDDEAIRAEAVRAGLLQGREVGFEARNAFVIDGIQLQTVHSAAEAVLRSRSRADIADPAALADWVEHDCGLALAASAIRRTIEIDDFELRRASIALALDRNCPIVWQQVPVNRNQITDFARSEVEQQLVWLQSLRDSGILAAYARHGNAQAAEIDRALRETEQRINSAFRELLNFGCDLTIPDGAAQWRMACQIAFAAGYREYYEERTSHLSDATGLFARPAWISRMAGQRDRLGVEQLLALDWAEQQNGLQTGAVAPVTSDAIPYREGTDEELHSAPLIWLKTQERLLGRMKISDILEPVRLRGGEYFPSNAGQLPLQQLRRWLRQVLYPWFTRRFRGDPAERLRTLGAVGDRFNTAPALNLSATLYQTCIKLNEAISGPETYACEVRWAAPDGYDVQLLLRSPGLFRDTVIWKTPRHGWVMRLISNFFAPSATRLSQPSGLSRIGSMALSLCQDTVLTLEARPRLPMLRRPVYRSGEIVIILPRPELAFLKQQEISRDRFELLKVDARINQPDIRQIPVTVQQIPVNGNIGDGLNFYEQMARAGRRTVRLLEAANHRKFRFSRRQHQALNEFFESQHHHQGNDRP